MTSAGPTRLAAVLSHPTQYYSPWFASMAGQSGLALRVFYLWDFGVAERPDPQFGAPVRWDVDLLGGYESEFVPNRARDPGTHHFRGLRNPALPRRLEAWRPDAVLLFGYKWISHLRAIAWARRRRVPLIFRGDSHFLGRSAPGAGRLLVLRWVYRQFAAVTYVGAANRAYFERLGVPAGKLFFAPHSVDGRRFQAGDPRRREEADALRRQLGLAPGTRVVLFAGKFVPAKGPRELLQAFLDLAPERAALVFVGEGRERAALESLGRKGRSGAVHFLPFANQSEMPARYQAADLFALPSFGVYETWGLAVNEAMHMGVPCLVSDRVGCQADLVIPGETGWVFSADRPGELKTRLGQALADLDDPAKRERLRQNLAARIAGYTYARTTEGLLQALAAVRAVPRR